MLNVKNTLNHTYLKRIDCIILAYYSQNEFKDISKYIISYLEICYRQLKILPIHSVHNNITTK